MLAHLVARARSGAPLADAHAAAWLWPELRARFPVVYGVIFMPNHLHLVGDVPADAPARLGKLLSGFSRRYRAGLLWEPASMVGVPDRKHLQRQVRYVALNECRSGLSRDPVEAPWSTHRDVLGGTIDPWVTANGLRDAVGWRTHNFPAAWHRYVTGDPTVAAEAGAMPIPSRVTLDGLARAAIAAHRSPPDALVRRFGARRTFAQLAEPVALDPRWLDPRLHRRFEHVPANFRKHEVSESMFEHRP